MKIITTRMDMALPKRITETRVPGTVTINVSPRSSAIDMYGSRVLRLSLSYLHSRGMQHSAVDGRNI